MFEIDTLTDGTTAYDQRVELDGVEYLMSLQWNGRRDKWALSLNAINGTDVLTGQNVCLRIPLNRRAVGGPPGVLVAVPGQADDDVPPGLLELGTRVRLVYFTAAELAAGEAT